MDFLWEYVPSTVLFHAQLITKKSINSSIDHRKHVWWPPNHRTMATRAIQHHRWCLSSPPLSSGLSILLWGWRNSLRSSAKMGRWWVRADLQHKMCSGGGTNETIGPGPVQMDLLNIREVVAYWGNTVINWVGWDRGGRDTTMLFWARGLLEANHGRCCPNTQQSTTELNVFDDQRISGGK
jgi:hypothetical protein